MSGYLGTTSGSAPAGSAATAEGLGSYPFSVVTTPARAGVGAAALPRWREPGSEPAIRASGEIEMIRAAGAVARAAVDAALRAAVPGASTQSLDAVVEGVIAAARAESAARGFRRQDGATFPAACVIAVNDRLVHALPTADPLRDGDVVTVDVAVRLRGWHADCAASAVVGQGTAEGHALVDAARAMLRAAMGAVAPGMRWSDVAAAMQDVAQSRGVGIVTDVSGHGIGRELHEAPEAPCALVHGLRDRNDFTLRPGMVIAIEPTIALRPDGDAGCVDADGCARPVALAASLDGWTLRIGSGLPGCYAEETVAVTRSGCESLTERTPTRIHA
jgi:methionyl aminopeptidase